MRVGYRVAAVVSATALTMYASTTVMANPVLLLEPETGRVLHAEESDRAWHPASITKLMTAYLTFDAVKSGTLAWDDEVPLSEHARAQPATRIGLRAGIKLNVEQAVRGLVLRSANDFATALAERIGGTEEKFVDAMNAAAKRLGMTRTVFRNPHGLPDPEQITTARDLAILTTALLKDFPDRAEVFSTPTVRIHKGTFHSQNDLLRTFFGADGMKTGFTCASGYNVVASATRDGHRLVAIVLGAINRQKRSELAAELLEAGFAHLGVATIPHGAVGGPQVGHAPKAAPAEAVGNEARHAIAITPVSLSKLAADPAEAVAPAEDIARMLRSGKCRGYGGFAKKETAPATSETEVDDEAPPVMTGSVAKPAVVRHSGPIAKAAVPPPAKAVPAKSPKTVAQAATPRKSTGPVKSQSSPPAPATPERPQGDGN